MAFDPRERFPPSPDPGGPPAATTPPPWGVKSDTGVVLPLAYGTVRVPGNLIERTAWQLKSTLTQFRLRSTLYALGDIVQNTGKLYICVVAGTTGTGDGPSGTGSGQTDGGVTWDYVTMGYRHKLAVAFCEGQIFGAGKAWQDKNVFAAYTSLPHESTWLQLNLGTPTGGRPVSPIWFPAQTDVYGNTVVLFGSMTTGSNSDLPTIELEIQGIFTDGTHADANPADIAIDLLTHARRGAQWPSARVDAVSTGSGAASWRTYCTATGFIMSWLIDSQTSALALMKQLCDATNTTPVWTNRLDGLGGMLKFVPLGTDSITANGVTFTPNLTPAYALGQDDYLSTITIDIVPPTETYNCFPIEFTSRARAYARDTVDDPEMSDVDVRGLVRAATTAMPMVLSPTSAVQIARIRAQRSLNIRNTYRAKLGWRFILLEPTDLVTLTEPDLGLSNLPARVTVFEEDQASGEITITCEDFPANVGHAKGYVPQAGDGFQPTTSTALGSLSVLPGQAPAVVVPDQTNTRGGSVDNLWPNQTSETNPPDGVDTTPAEWAGRVNLGAGAYAGDWVRSPGLGASLGITYDVVAAPGEIYYVSAQVKAAAAAANKGGFVKITALDKTGSSLGSASSARNDTTSYVSESISLLMPASTVTVRFSLLNGTDASAQAYFDSIYARRAVSGPILGDGTAWFGQAWFAMATIQSSNGTGSGSGNFINISSVAAGATYNAQGSIRITWTTPPAAFAPSGSVVPVVTTKQAVTWASGLEWKVKAIGSNWIDLQAFTPTAANTAPSSIAANGDQFDVHIFLWPSTGGYAL